MAYQRRSRLIHHVEGEKKKQIFFFIVAIGVIVFLLFRFSPAIVDGIGSLLLNVNEDNESAEPTKTLEALTAPRLESKFTATQSARITIKGTASRGDGTIELFVNEKLSDKEKLNDTDFEITNIQLTEGENVIKARQVVDNKTSGFSSDLTILYVKEEVGIEELSPSDGQEFKKGDQEIEVSGKTDPNSKVTVNGFRAIVDQDGRFSYLLRLNDGENTITVKAESPLGKTDEKSIKVKYTP